VVPVIFSLDVSLGALLLLAAAVAAFSQLSLAIHETADAYGKFLLQKKLLDASESLVTTAGYPPDWDAKTVRRLGLARVAENSVKHHEIDAAKLRLMRRMDKSRIAGLLALDGYDVGIKITEIDGHVLLEKGSVAGTSVRRFALCPEPCVVELAGVRLHG
jgi:hypothetical protein